MPNRESGVSAGMGTAKRSELHQSGVGADFRRNWIRLPMETLQYQRIVKILTETDRIMKEIELPLD